MPRSWSSPPLADALTRFVTHTDKLSGSAWKAWAARENLPSAGVMVHHLGLPEETFTHLLTRWAVSHADANRVFLWARCPQGATHSNFPWVGTPGEHRASAACGQCDKWRAWEESRLTSAEKHPDLVAHLAFPTDAQSKGRSVLFRCCECSAIIKWSPSVAGAPLCGYCLAAQGQPPGTQVPRRGGGDTVRLEAQLAAALQKLGVIVTSDEGIVVPRGTYYVGVIKPDLLLPDHGVALEVDLDRPPSRHGTPEGVEDDLLRDHLLADVGWQVLRIRRPGLPTRDAWPWRIETRSTAPGRLARLVLDSLAALADVPVAAPSALRGDSSGPVYVS